MTIVMFVIVNSLHSRIKQMVDQRQALIDERRKASIATKLQKESIAKMMEEVRTNASKANKLIKKAMTGNMSMDSLLSSSPSKSSRSRSADKSKHKKSDGVRSVSASGQQHDDVSHDLKYSTNFNQTAPEPYVSPYVVNT
jgi:hypothetical protein